MAPEGIREGTLRDPAHAGPAHGIGAGAPEPTAGSAGTADDTGSSITITVPGPSFASTRMLPLWSSTIFFVMASPSPKPVALVGKKRAKTRSRSATGIPEP